MSRVWCKTIVTTSFYIRSFNSFAPSPRCVMNCFENITTCFSSPCHFCVTMLSVVRRQCVCALTFFIQTTSPLKPLIGLLANFTRMSPAWPHTNVAQTVPGDSISRLQGKTNRFSKFNFQISSCPKLQKAKAFVLSM